MKSIRDSCIELLKSEDTRKNIREIIQPISDIIYNVKEKPAHHSNALSVYIYGDNNELLFKKTYC